MTKHEFENLKTGDLLKSKFSIFIFIDAWIVKSKRTSYYVTHHFDLRKACMVYLNLLEPWKYFVKI